jgi:hypothetical protein
VHALLILACGLPLLGALPASAIGAISAAGLDPCELALRPADLPAQLAPDTSGLASLDLSEDPDVCERVFQAPPDAEVGVTLVRSLIFVAVSPQQAASDFDEYRALLVDSGWDEVGSQPLGDAGVAFSGSDPAAGIYTLQHHFRRGRVVGLVEVTGPRLLSEPESALGLAKLVDLRITRGLPLVGSGGSAFPSVRVPTLVGDARLGQSLPLTEALSLGGFSGLVSLGQDGTSFLSVTDRGPSLEAQVGGKPRTLFGVPGYTPSIVRLELREGQLSLAERIPLRLPDGLLHPRTGTPFVTGLPALATDPPAYDLTGKTTYAVDPLAVDPRGVARDPRDGSYWLSEALGPSLLNVAPDGSILSRLVPAGSPLASSPIPTRAVLPSELGQRRPGRGLEGVAVSPDGSRLFAIMGSSLPMDSRPQDNSRLIRLLSLNLQAGEPSLDGEYLYLAEAAPRLGLRSQDELRVADLAALSASRLLVMERDSAEGGTFKMVYRFDLAQATNVLGVGGTAERTLDQTDPAELQRLGYQFPIKEPVINVALLGYKSKVDGLAVVDASTLAMINDNDFGLAGVDSAGRPIPNAIQTRLTLVHLPVELNR